ncbi:N-acetylmuramoyl-L-alanine amidase [Alphaproteobacteria bacterium]|nr:N-acetylmuramoyl-L-alanine amidase [Alphaproteobacteria bacterium]
MKFINKYKSINYNQRSKQLSIKYIIVHYTAMRTDLEAINYLCNKKNQVSSHFLINKVGKIFNLVDIQYRAWHAGKSYWEKERDINSSSIGIEIDNSGHHLDFENYNSLQIKAIVKLLIFLKKKYKIKSHNILAHSDISPYRKNDPGEKFPWHKLSSKKIVIMPKLPGKKLSAKIDHNLKRLSLRTIEKKTLHMLGVIGYDVKQAKGNRKKFKTLIKAYQMHFRKSLVNGYLDSNTYEIIKGHFNQSLTV